MTLDHHISLAYLNSDEVKRIGSDLRSDPSDTSAGWYLRAYCNEGYTDIIKYTRVNPDGALAIAQVIDQQLHSAQTLVRAVQAANAEHAKRRAEGIKFLEKRIAEDTAALARARAEAPEKPRVCHCPARMTGHRSDCQLSGPIEDDVMPMSSQWGPS